MNGPLEPVVAGLLALSSDTYPTRTAGEDEARTAFLLFRGDFVGWT